MCRVGVAVRRDGFSRFGAPTDQIAGATGMTNDEINALPT